MIRINKEVRTWPSQFEQLFPQFIFLRPFLCFHALLRAVQNPPQALVRVPVSEKLRQRPVFGENKELRAQVAHEEPLISGVVIIGEDGKSFKVPFLDRVGGICKGSVAEPFPRHL